MSHHRRAHAIQGGHNPPASSKTGNKDISDPGIVGAFEEVKKVVPPPIPKLDPETLDWSDEESDWNAELSTRVALVH